MRIDESANTHVYSLLNYSDNIFSLSLCLCLCFCLSVCLSVCLSLSFFICLFFSFLFRQPSLDGGRGYDVRRDGVERDDAVSYTHLTLPTT